MSNVRMLLGDGIAQARYEALSTTVRSTCDAKGVRAPHLVILSQHDGNGPTASLIELKKKRGEACGIIVTEKNFDRGTASAEISSHVALLEADPSVDGILLQLPFVDEPDLTEVFSQMKAKKDVDRFSTESLGLAFLGREDYRTAVTKAVFAIIDEYDIDLKGKMLTVLGSGLYVGNTIAQACIRRGATVTVCNEYTQDLASCTLRADIVISCTGKKHLVQPEMVSDNTVLIDVGFGKDLNGVYGDADPRLYESELSLSLTPVPGGIGPLTIASVLAETVRIWSIHYQQLA